MSVMQAHVGRMFAMANGRAPFDAKAVADNADIAAAMSKWQFSGFVPGSDKGDTKAEPKIWAEMDTFGQKADKSQEDLVKAERRSEDRQCRCRQSGCRCGRAVLQGLPRQLPQGMRRSSESESTEGPAPRRWRDRSCASGGRPAHGHPLNSAPDPSRGQQRGAARQGQRDAPPQRSRRLPIGRRPTSNPWPTPQ